MKKSTFLNRIAARTIVQVSFKEISRRREIAIARRIRSRNSQNKKRLRDGRNDIKDAVILFLGSKCKSCGSRSNIHIDHIKPLCLKGKNEIKNFQLLCFPCHRKKTRIDISKWRIKSIQARAAFRPTQNTFDKRFH